MKDIKFTLAARCEAAGRDSNEDNYQIIADIAADRHGFTANEELTLGGLGTLLVVCDGMGGMNAGEVASAIAVQTVKDCFCKSKITKDALSKPEKFISAAIQSADAAIKAESKRNPATEGMGSTIVLVWLLHGKAYVGWCGDSRAYRYNAVSGLERLSHDHSYVQELVDVGSITEELAFFHPNNNIITRSLGDPRGAAQPDVRVYDIQQGDLYLLCSDGLCGCLQDHQIQAVIEQHYTTVSECRDALWAADEAAGWHDNVTTILAQITAGGIPPIRHTTEAASKEAAISASKARLLRTNRRLKLIIAAILAVVLIAAASIAICCFLPDKDTPSGDVDAPSAVEESATPMDTRNNNKSTDEPSAQSAPAELPVTSPTKATAPSKEEKAKQDSIEEEKARKVREQKEQQQLQGGIRQVQKLNSVQEESTPEEPAKGDSVGAIKQIAQ